MEWTSFPFSSQYLARFCYRVRLFCHSLNVPNVQQRINLFSNFEVLTRMLKFGLKREAQKVLSSEQDVTIVHRDV